MQSRKFSRFFIMSMIGLQGLTVMLVIVFFYRITSNDLETKYNQSIRLETAETSRQINDLFVDLQNDLTELSYSNTLRVSMTLGLDNQIEETIEEKMPRLPAGARLYIYYDQKERFFPAAPINFRNEFIRAIKEGGINSGGKSYTMIHSGESFFTIQTLPVTLKNGTSLGRLFMVYDLSRNPTLLQKFRYPDQSIIIVKYEGKHYNLISGNPIDFSSKEFQDNYLVMDIRNELRIELFYGNPVSGRDRQMINLITRFALLCALVLAITLVIALLINIKHSAALQNLVGQAAHLAVSNSEGSLQEKNLEFHEFCELAGAFNGVLSRLRSSRDEIDQLNRDLESRVERRTAQLRQTNEKLVMREKQFKLIVENSPGAICMFDASRKPLVASRKWDEFFGAAPAWGTAGIFFASTSQEENFWELVFTDCLQGRMRFSREHRIRIGGHERWISWEAYPWSNEEGNSGGVIFFVEDITTRKWSESALRKAAIDAENANRLKSEFLANISHEIRTPLNCIMGFAEIISENDNIESMQQKAQLIVCEAESMLNLIGDLLDFSKIEAGKLELEESCFDLHKMLEAIEPGVQMRLRQKPVSYCTTISPEVPRYLKGDFFRLRQIILNLVHNAVKFTEDGSISLNVRPRLISENNCHLLFEIKDTGIGIAKDKQGMIFEKFTQADGSTTRKYGGTGLGTAISKKLVELMQGEIGLESEEGKGSLFWFTVQLAFCANEEIAQKDKQAQYAEKTTKKIGGRLLLAEDYEMNRMVICSHLESAGFEVDVAVNGLEAVEKFIGNKYSIILLDLSMPHMDGFTAVQKLRNAGCWQPVIALTASTEPEIEQKCLKSGFDCVVTKPVRKQDLLKQVEHWLNLIHEESQAERLDKYKTFQTNSMQPPVPTEKQAALIDYDTLLSDYAGRRKVLRGILEKFATSLSKQIPILLKAANEKDRYTLREESHKITGAAGNLMLERMYRLSMDLNDAAKQEDFPSCAKIADAMDKELLEFIEFLKNLPND